MRTFVETMCNGNFLSKSPEGALLYFDELAEGAQNWNTYTDESKSKSFDRGLVSSLQGWWYRIEVSLIVEKSWGYGVQQTKRE